MSKKEQKTGLDLLREPFEAHQISKLPKATKAQNEALKSDRSLGINCTLCNQWHHKNAVHLDYVGHAALTDRLLEADKNWNWEPLAFTPEGLPAFDKTGGLWIKLTVCNQTRLGYGHAESSSFKEIGSREKEVIGDALRNAAMRFGAALDLWHKGDLRLDEDDATDEKPKIDPKKATEGYKAETKELNKQELESYVFKMVTMLKGKKITEVKKSDLVSSMQKTNREKYKGALRDELDMIFKWIQLDHEEKLNSEPKLNEKEEIPF